MYILDAETERIFSSFIILKKNVCTARNGSTRPTAEWARSSLHFGGHVSASTVARTAHPARPPPPLTPPRSDHPSRSFHGRRVQRPTATSVRRTQARTVYADARAAGRRAEAKLERVHTQYAEAEPTDRRTHTYVRVYREAMYASQLASAISINTNCPESERHVRECTKHYQTNY